jgi:hypothetical protein
MIRGKFLRENHLKYECYHHAEDYKLWFEIAKKGGTFYIIPQPLLNYRLSNNQISLIHWQEQQETSWRIKLEILDCLVANSSEIYPNLQTVSENVWRHDLSE